MMANIVFFIETTDNSVTSEFANLTSDDLSEQFHSYETGVSPDETKVSYL